MKHSPFPFTPQWVETPAPSGSWRSVFKWGDPAVYKHPSQRLYTLLKEKLALTDKDFASPLSTGEKPVVLDCRPRLDPRHVEALKLLVGAENVACDDLSRVRYATGQSAEELMTLRGGVPFAITDCAVHPRQKQDVCEVIAYCHREHIPVTVYSGGSSVTQGLTGQPGGIALVMQTHMNRVLDFNECDQTITVEPGIFGPALETALNEATTLFKAGRAYTCGHFPQSFEFSTVGGWVMALGSGQASSYYGDACDLVAGIEVVTPVGTLATRPFPATATGPKIDDIFNGSEGTFGILVSVTLKVFRHQPDTRRRFAYMFPDWTAAVTASREISQGEFGMPAVFRISDPEETEMAMTLYGVDHPAIDRFLRFKGLPTGSRCLCIGHTAGDAGLSRLVARKVRRICRHHRAISLTGYPARRWERGRFKDPYLREDLYDYGITIDTLETAVAWSDLHRLYAGVRQTIKARPQTICLTHSSHFYAQGTNLYFIFIGRFQGQEAFHRFHCDIVDAIVANGGSLSHHHGVGRLFAPWMKAHLGDPAMALLAALKRHFDPHEIMNPGGTLGLDESEPIPQENQPK